MRHEFNGLRCGVLAMALLLGGCATVEAPNSEFTGFSNVAPKATPIERSHMVYFETNKDTVSSGEREALAAFLSGLGELRGIRVRVRGHADERASDAYNLDLSSRRADKVAALVRDMGRCRCRCFLFR